MPVQVRRLLMRYGVGWRRTLEEVHDKNSRAQAAQQLTRDLDRMLPHDVLATLGKRNGLDEQLYRSAR